MPISWGSQTSCRQSSGVSRKREKLAGMQDENLLAWFKSGVTEYMEALAVAEGELVGVLQLAVADSSVEHIGRIRRMADALTSAARNALSWLSQHPSPNVDVDAGMLRAWESYVSAGTTIRKMVDGEVPMSPESGEQARAAVERAQKENWAFAMAFGRAVGRH